MNNTKTLNYSTPRLQDVWSLLWDRLGSKRMLFIIGLLFSLAQSISMMLDPLFVNIYFNQLELREYDNIQLLVVISTTAFLILVVVAMLGEYLKQISMSKLNIDLMLELVDEAQRLPIERAQASHSSDLVQRVTHDTYRTTRLLSITMDNMVDQFVMFMLASIYMLWLNWKIALTILTISPLMLLASHLLRHQIRRIGRDVAEQEAVVRQCQQDALQGLEIIRAYGIADWMRDRFVEERARLNTLYMRRTWWYQTISLLTLSFSNLMIIGTVLVVGWLAINKSMALGTLIVYFTLIWRINSPLQSLGNLWGQVQESLGASVRIFALWQAEKEPGNGETATSVLSGSNGICLQNVHFEYLEHSGLQDAGAQVDDPKQEEFYDGKGLENFDLQVIPGSFVAIVGPSGSGKSTVAKLAAGLLFPSEGEIRVGGLNPLEDAERARRMVAYVPQVPYLFSGTIRDNLTIARPEVGEDAMIEAARMAQAHDFIKMLPKGYDTEISEHGNSLSGGQQQRLAIARALLAHRPIWIFDEATSALDTSTEYEIMKVLRQSVKEDGRTLLVIAHRLTTIQDADHIVVMEKGSIQQQGRHVDLWNDSEALYRQLWRQVSSA